jgi:hypothetical protein
MQVYSLNMPAIFPLSKTRPSLEPTSVVKSRPSPAPLTVFTPDLSSPYVCLTRSLSNPWKFKREETNQEGEWRKNDRNDGKSDSRNTE